MSKLKPECFVCHDEGNGFDHCCLFQTDGKCYAKFKDWLECPSGGKYSEDVMQDV